jgi:hypothetical protein
MLLTRGLGQLPFSGGLLEFDIAVNDQMGFDVQIYNQLEFAIDIADDAAGGFMEVKFKQGESKTLAFTVTNGGAAFPLAGVTGLTFVVKKDKQDVAILISKAKADFTILDNVASVLLTSAETGVLEQGLYVGELTVVATDQNIQKSADMTVEVERAVSV